MKKTLVLFGVLFFMVFILSACGNTTNTVLENAANNNVLLVATLEDAEACIGYDLPDEVVVIGILQNEDYCELSLNIDSDFKTMKSYFNKADGSTVPNGSLEFLFSRKAVFQFEKTEGMEIEELEFSLIDAGLDEIEEEDDSNGDNSNGDDSNGDSAIKGCTDSTAKNYDATATEDDGSCEFEEDEEEEDNTLLYGGIGVGVLALILLTRK